MSRYRWLSCLSLVAFAACAQVAEGYGQTAADGGPEDDIRHRSEALTPGANLIGGNLGAMVAANTSNADRTFHGDGVRYVPYERSTMPDYTNVAFAVRPDERVIVLAQQKWGDTNRAVLVSLAANGEPDTTFGSGWSFGLYGPSVSANEF